MLTDTELIPAPALMKRLLPELEKISDIQIALTHCGREEDTEIASSNPGLDAILGGHSHTRMKNPDLVDEIPICHAGAHGRLMGRLDLTIDPANPKKVQKFEYKLLQLPVPASTSALPKNLVTKMERLRKSVKVLEDEILGKTKIKLWRSYHRDSAMGGAVANALRKAAGTQVGFINSGGIRTNFSKGPITRAKLWELIPFSDVVVRLTLTGKELKQILKYNAEAAAKKKHGILQMAGVRGRFKVHPSGDVSVLNLRVDGKRIKRNETYTVATNSFIGETQAKKYLGMVPGSLEKLDLLVRDAIEKAIKNGTLVPPRKPRLILIGKPNK